MALPEDPESRRMELYDGEVIYMPPPANRHGKLSKQLLLALDAFVQEHNLGDVRFEIGFKIRSNPDRVVAPDVCWVSKQLLERTGDPEGYLPAAPTLAVEVISPSDLDRDADRKAKEYLDAGTQRVWLVRPHDETVTVHRPNGDSHRYGPDDVLTSDDAGFGTAGFELAVGKLFA